jgi:hypothetical protein
MLVAFLTRVFIVRHMIVKKLDGSARGSPGTASRAHEEGQDPL